MFFVAASQCRGFAVFRGGGGGTFLSKEEKVIVPFHSVPIVGD
jgi:hypothetical protein